MSTFNFTLNQTRLLRASIILFCLLSTLTNMIFWVSLAPNAQGKILFSAFVILFEVAKYFAATIMFCQKRLSVSCGLMFLVLSAMSVLGTTTVLEEWIAAKSNAQAKSSESYRLLAKQISDQQTLLAQISKSAEIDIKNGFRARANKQFDKAAALQVKISILSQQLEEKKEVGTYSPNLLTMPVLFVLGSLLELVGVFLFFLSGSVAPQEHKIMGAKEQSIQDHGSKGAKSQDQSIKKISIKSIGSKQDHGIIGAKEQSHGNAPEI